MTVRYSPIGPLPVLRQLQELGLLGNYLLLLAHEVLKEPRGYIDLVDAIISTPEDPRFIIMDNGVIERGAPVNVGDLLEAANLVEADCVVTPDVIGDASATKKLIMDQGHIVSRAFPLMRIPQGTCHADVFACIDWLNDRLPSNGGLSYWGVPRWFTNALTSRSPAIDHINEVCPKAQIHLLGMSTNLQDDQRCLLRPNIIGIDSANPIVMGLMNMKMHQGLWTHMDRGNYWDCKQIHSAVVANVEFMHNALSG